MDRRELLDRTAQDAEERLLLSRVWDKREQCRQRNIPAATDFLSPQEQAAAQLGKRPYFILIGGGNFRAHRGYIGVYRCG